ncbi:MAG: small subunit of acetolactate synthase-domain-containing protein [Monoraphidium minutum]|nr:MAG: small subunit of acetolactate synthase-domain-containing protein [Monoraphidium minutum]
MISASMHASVAAGVANKGSRLLHAPPRSLAGCSASSQRAFASVGHAKTRSPICAAVQPFLDTKTEEYDVYVSEPEPLEAGEEKHVISIFVADEAGLINRVAGVFARRGANIDSLAVGLNDEKALFTIVVTGTRQTVSNLVKQLSKLVKVRYVEDITTSNRVERELELIKLRAPAGPARTEVLQLAEVFRARVVDMSEGTMTLCASGDPGKTAALSKMLAKFGVLEVCRTGRISLKRGEDLLENLRAPVETPAFSGGSEVMCGALESREGDVYQVAKADMHGVWEVPTVNLIEPQTYSRDKGADRDDEEYRAHTLSILVADLPGVLQEVTMVFARRSYNVQSLAVGPAETPGDSRITTVVPGTTGSISKLIKQVKKLVNVKACEDITSRPYVARELMLVKVRCTPSQRGELRHLSQIFRMSIIDVAPTTMVLEAQGREAKMKAIVDLLEPYGVLETARTGRIALARESGVDSKYLESMKSSSRIF